MRGFWDRVDTRAVAERVCPFCWAGTGQRCMTINGNVLSVPHVQRSNPIYWEELQKKKQKGLTE